MQTERIGRNVLAMTTNMITATEAAALTGRTRQTINRWVAEGRLTPTSRVGGNGLGLYRREDVLDAAHKRPEVVAPTPAAPTLVQAAEEAFLALFDDFLAGYRGDPRRGEVSPPAEAAYVAGRRAAARS